MNPLKNKILNLISSKGPLTIAQYMDIALFDQGSGYYNGKNPIGSRGAFTTAPEITQVFGELIGLFFAQYWLDCGKYNSFTLLELGPGKGTLMSDLLRSSRIVPEYLEACDIFLLERSSSLELQQRKTLHHPIPTWINSLENLPDQPVFALANEFFDALPIRQFIRGERFWKERLVASTGNELHFVWSREFNFKPLEGRLGDTKEGDIVEVRPDTDTFMIDIVDRIKQYGGIFLIIDYGENYSLGDTFQAMVNNEYTNPLESPGLADLTSHVDFAALVKGFADIAVSPLVEQGAFLTNLGIMERSDILAKNLAGVNLESHRKAIDRLVSPDQMGILFKVRAIYPTKGPVPQGFN